MDLLDLGFKVDPCFNSAPYTNQIHESNAYIFMFSSLHNFAWIKISKYIIGPTIRMENMISIHTGVVKGANKPEPFAESCGLFIRTTHSERSK